MNTRNLVNLTIHLFAKWRILDWLGAMVSDSKNSHCSEFLKNNSKTTPWDELQFRTSIFEVLRSAFPF